MLTLQGDSIFLRALEPEDLEFIYTIENDEQVWEMSGTQTPYSRFLIRQYLENAKQDIYEAKQLRLAIAERGDNTVLGMIDVFDFNPTHHRAGIGILIADRQFRGKGYGGEALKLVVDYCKTHLQLHQLYANILEENNASIQLFEQAGFQLAGVKKDWNLVQGIYKNELLYQLIYVH